MRYRISRGKILVFTVLCVCATLAVSQVGHAATRNSLHFKVIGTCVSDSNGGVLHSDAWGFTPNGNYVTTAKYPNDKPYLGLTNPGTVDKLGHTSRWNWDCAAGANGKPDTPGVYSLKIKDITTGMSVSAKLRVLPAKCQYPGSKNCDFSQP